MNPREALAQFAQDVRNLEWALNSFGGGDGTPLSDPEGYRDVAHALAAARTGLIRAARAYTGTPEEKEAALVKRRKRIAEIFAAGVAWSASFRKDTVRGQNGNDPDDALIREASRDYARGKVADPK